MAMKRTKRKRKRKRRTRMSRLEARGQHLIKRAGSPLDDETRILFFVCFVLVLCSALQADYLAHWGHWQTKILAANAWNREMNTIPCRHGTNEIEYNSKGGDKTTSSLDYLGISTISCYNNT
jgi:hypothetical protein